MRWTDLIRLPLTLMGQQKLRTCLTTLGVLFGAFVLAASLSINEGVQQTIEREASKGDIQRKVTVHAGWRKTATKATEQVKVNGRMTPERYERIHRIVALRARNRESIMEQVKLTKDRLDALARIPHVAQMVPIVGEPVVATLGNRPEDASVSCGAGETPALAKRIVFGRPFHADDERSVLLSEMFAYRIGLVDDTDLAQVIGKPLRIEIRGVDDAPSFNVTLAGGSKPSGGRDEQLGLRQLAWQLPEALDRFSLTDEESVALRKAVSHTSAQGDPHVVAGDFRVVGIFRELTDEEEKDAWSEFPAHTDLVLPRRTAVDFTFREPDHREDGIGQVVLFVDDIRHVKEVVDAVKALGLESRSIVEFVEQQRLTYLLIFSGMTSVAVVALLVSSLGIANTMLMSVLERRREIGIMKAVGAANWQLQALFLMEGALIGLVGGSLGLLLACAISYPGDTWTRAMVHRDMKIQLSGSIFAFPTWIGVTVVCFTTGATMLAAFFPSRRAARVDPVSALRND